MPPRVIVVAVPDGHPLHPQFTWGENRLAVGRVDAETMTVSDLRKADGTRLEGSARLDEVRSVCTLDTLRGLAAQAAKLVGGD